MPNISCDAHGEIAVGDLIPAINRKVEKAGDAMSGPLEVPDGAQDKQVMNADDINYRIKELIALIPTPDVGTRLSTDGNSIVKTDGSVILNQIVAFAHVSGFSNPPVANSEINIASIVRLGTGVYNIKFKTPMDINHYTAISNCDESHAFTSCDGYTASGFKIMIRKHDGRMVNDNFEIIVIGGRV